MENELTKHEQRQQTVDLLDRLKGKLLDALDYETEQNIQTNRIGQAKALDYLFKNMMAHGVEHDFNLPCFMVAMRAQNLFQETTIILEKEHDWEVDREWREDLRHMAEPIPWYDAEKNDTTQRGLQYLAEQREAAKNRE